MYNTYKTNPTYIVSCFIGSNINVLCDLVGRYRDDGRLILRPGGKEKEPTLSLSLLA